MGVGVGVGVAVAVPPIYHHHPPRHPPSTCMTPLRCPLSSLQGHYSYGCNFRCGEDSCYGGCCRIYHYHYHHPRHFHPHFLRLGKALDWHHWYLTPPPLPPPHRPFVCVFDYSRDDVRGEDGMMGDDGMMVVGDDVRTTTRAGWNRNR